MKKIFMAICLSLILFPLSLISGCGGEQGNDTKDNAEKIIIGIDEHYAPMGFRNEKNELVGFDIDLAKETAKRMGVEVEFKPIDWNKKEEELKVGNIDIIWNGLDITPERKENILYSKPYMDNRQILLVKRGNALGIHAESDLAGKVVGTQAGSNSETYVNQNENLKNGFAAFKTYDNYRNAFKDLDDGVVDVLICDEIAGRYEMSLVPQKFDPIEVTIGPATEIGIGFRKDDTELRDKVQMAFDDMIKDGTTRKISEEWFQADLIKSKR